MSDPLVTLVIPARSEYLILARLALAGIAREVEMSDETLSDLKLAVTEACANAVAHAYGDGQGTVEVRFLVSPGSVTIEVQDDGERETPEVPATMPALEGDALPESGMGLAIIQAIVDELEVEARDGAGTVVRLVKKL